MLKKSEAVIKTQKHNIDEQIDKLEIFEVLIDNVYRTNSLFFILYSNR